MSAVEKYLIIIDCSCSLAIKIGFNLRIPLELACDYL